MHAVTTRSACARRERGTGSSRGAPVAGLTLPLVCSHSSSAALLYETPSMRQTGSSMSIRESGQNHSGGTWARARVWVRMKVRARTTWAAPARDGGREGAHAVSKQPCSAHAHAHAHAVLCYVAYLTRPYLTQPLIPDLRRLPPLPRARGVGRLKTLCATCGDARLCACIRASLGHGAAEPLPVEQGSNDRGFRPGSRPGRDLEPCETCVLYLSRSV